MAEEYGGGRFCRFARLLIACSVELGRMRMAFLGNHLDEGIQHIYFR